MGHLKLNWKNIGLLTSWIMLPLSVWMILDSGKLYYLLITVWCIYRQGNLFYKR